MAGSYGHIAYKIKGLEGTHFIGPILLDHMGDACGALEECFFLIHYLSNDNDELIKDALKQYYNPSTPLAIELRKRLDVAEENGYWEEHGDEVLEKK